MLDKIAFEFREINGKGFRTAEPRLKRFSYHSRMMLIQVGSKGRVPSLSIALNCFEGHLLCKPVHLICRVRRRPIHGLLKRIHRLGGQLDVAVARLTLFQLLDVVRLQSETVEVGKLWRIAELSNCEITGEFAHRINVRSK